MIEFSGKRNYFFLSFLTVLYRGPNMQWRKSNYLKDFFILDYKGIHKNNSQNILVEFNKRSTEIITIISRAFFFNATFHLKICYSKCYKNISRLIVANFDRTFYNLDLHLFFSLLLFNINLINI